MEPVLLDDSLCKKFTSGKIFTLLRLSGSILHHLLQKILLTLLTCCFRIGKSDPRLGRPLKRPFAAGRQDHAIWLSNHASQRDGHATSIPSQLRDTRHLEMERASAAFYS